MSSKRDLRLDTQGAFGGVESTTIEKHEEAAVRFDRSGRLAHSPPQRFVPRR